MSGRTCLLTMCVITLWVALVVRLVQVQCLDQYGLANIVDRQRSYCEVLRARPGDLLDRHGGLLVTTVETFSLFVDPRLLTDTDTAARELSRITGEHTVRLVERLRERHESRFLWVARHLSVETARQARRLNLPPGSWGLRSEFHRVYPQGTLAAHLIGWRNIDGVGQSGLERVLEGRLRGIDGSRTLLRDARGFVIEVTSDPGRPAVNGPDISLTIDTVIQLFAEEAIDVLQEQWNPRSAVAIVMEPQTGEILAMAARPTFDPHHPGDVASRHWLNPAVSLAFEPGSTLKPLFVARALDAGLVRRDEMVDCGGGTYQMGSRTLHDHHPYGALSLGDVLVKSSNIGMARIGERLTNSGLHQALRDFGFGKPTQLGLPSESPGFVRPLSEWTAYSTGSVPMGQEVAVTPVQLITAFSALANGGRMIAPRLVRDTAGSSADRAPRMVTQVANAETSAWLIRGPLVDVVERGTARRGKVDGYAVFGKTGTAQKFDAATSTYSSERHVTSCLLGAPAENPQVVVLVLVDEPAAAEAAGGTVAAPAAAEILRRTLVYLDVPHSGRAAVLAEMPSLQVIR